MYVYYLVFAPKNARTLIFLLEFFFLGLRFFDFLFPFEFFSGRTKKKPELKDSDTIEIMCHRMAFFKADKNWEFGKIVSPDSLLYHVVCSYDKGQQVKLRLTTTSRA